MSTITARARELVTNNAQVVLQQITDGSIHVDASPYIVAITKSDATTYSPALLGIRVGTTAGDIKVVSNGVDVTISGVQVGETIPGNITKVYSTGTTAVGLIGWQRA